MTGAVCSEAGSMAREPLARLACSVESRLGLMRSQWLVDDILRAVADMAAEMQRNPSDLLRDLASLDAGEAYPDDFVAALTVGETYFFREKKFLNAFFNGALRELPVQKKSGELLIWSAGCSTGEEAYTLAMIPPRTCLNLWAGDVSVIGTDINLRALEKARRGVYSRWSLRGMPDDEISLYFSYEGEGRYSVKEPYRKAVRFRSLNLAGEPWRFWRDSVPPDAVFCRNVLIYFSDEKKKEVIKNFFRILPEGGWLVMSACETASFDFEGFVPVDFDGATLFRKTARLPHHPPEPGGSTRYSGPGPDDPVQSPDSHAFCPPARKEKESVERDESESPFCPARARELADRGRPGEALEELNRVIDRRGARPDLLYLRSLIFCELGNKKEAAADLRSVLYLDPGFAMAHYTLGAMALAEGEKTKADRHLRNACEALARLAGDSIPGGGDGQTACEVLKAVRNLRSGI